MRRGKWYKFLSQRRWDYAIILDLATKLGCPIGLLGADEVGRLNNGDILQSVNNIRGFRLSPAGRPFIDFCLRAAIAIGASPNRATKAIERKNIILTAPHWELGSCGFAAAAAAGGGWGSLDVGDKGQQQPKSALLA